MNNNRDPFTGNLTAEPELNCPPKGTAVVNASLANNELYTSEGGERQANHYLGRCEHLGQTSREFRNARKQRSGNLSANLDGFGF